MYGYQRSCSLSDSCYSPSVTESQYTPETSCSESEAQRQFIEVQSDKVRSAFRAPWSQAQAQAQGATQAKAQLQLPPFAPARLVLPEQLPIIQHDASSSLEVPKVVDPVPRVDATTIENPQINQPTKSFLPTKSSLHSSKNVSLKSAARRNGGVLGVSCFAAPYE